MRCFFFVGTPGGRLRGDQRDAAEREAVLTEKVARLEAECTALRDAFDTVSDVLVEETDALRAAFDERLRAGEARARRQERALEALTRELGALRADHGALSAEMLPCRALLDSTHQEVGFLRKEAGGIEALRGALDGVQAREREGARTLEQLKAGGSQRAESLTQLRQEHVSLRDQVYALKPVEIFAKTLFYQIGTRCIAHSSGPDPHSCGSALRNGSCDREDYSHAATALAQDVAALAADAGALRTNHNKLAQTATASWETAQREHAAARARDQQEVREKVGTLSRDVRLQQDLFRKAQDAGQDSQRRLRQAVEETVTRVESENRQALTALKTSAGDGARQLAELKAGVDAFKGEVSRQHEAVQHAIMAFADILHVSSPLVAL